MTTATKKITKVAQTVTAKVISNRLYHAKEAGRRILQIALAELRDSGAIVIKFKLNISTAALEAHADELIEHYDGIAATEKVQTVDVDDDRALRCTLPEGTIVDNYAAAKMGYSQTDTYANCWTICKRSNMGHIQVVKNGAGHYMALAGDAVFLAAYFDRPILTRRVHSKTGLHVLAATYIDGDDVMTYKLKVAQLGHRMMID